MTNIIPISLGVSMAVSSVLLIYLKRRADERASDKALIWLKLMSMEASKAGKKKRMYALFDKWDKEAEQLRAEHAKAEEEARLLKSVSDWTLNQERARIEALGESRAKELEHHYLTRHYISLARKEGSKA